MDWGALAMTFITACIPAFIAYLSSSKQAKTKLEEVDKNFKLEIEKIDKTHKAEIEKMTKEFELASQSKENELLYGLTEDLLRGKITVDQLQATSDKVSKMNNKTNFTSRRK